MSNDSKNQQRIDVNRARELVLLAQQGDASALAQLARHYHAEINKIAFWFAKNKPVCGFLQDDFYQLAFIGFMDAIRKFDPNNKNGASFWTYARLRIQGAILSEIRNYGGTVKMGRGHMAVIKTVKKTRSALEQRHGGNSHTMADIAEELDADIDELNRKMSTSVISITSFNSLVANLGRDGDNRATELIDTFVSEELLPDDLIVFEESKQMLVEFLLKAKKLLSSRQREVFELRYGLVGDGSFISLKKISENFGVSEGRICQMISALWAKIEKKIFSQSSTVATMSLKGRLITRPQFLLISKAFRKSSSFKKKRTKISEPRKKRVVSEAINDIFTEDRVRIVSARIKREKGGNRKMEKSAITTKVGANSFRLLKVLWPMLDQEEGVIINLGEIAEKLGVEKSCVQAWRQDLVRKNFLVRGEKVRNSVKWLRGSNPLASVKNGVGRKVYDLNNLPIILDTDNKSDLPPFVETVAVSLPEKTTDREIIVGNLRLLIGRIEESVAVKRGEIEALVKAAEIVSKYS